MLSLALGIIVIQVNRTNTASINYELKRKSANDIVACIHGSRFTFNSFFLFLPGIHNPSGRIMNRSS